MVGLVRKKSLVGLVSRKKSSRSSKSKKNSSEQRLSMVVKVPNFIREIIEEKRSEKVKRKKVKVSSSVNQLLNMYRIRVLVEFLYFSQFKKLSNLYKFI